MDRYNKGLQELAKVIGKEESEVVVATLRGIYEPYANFMVEGFGDISTHDVLDLRSKELLVIASLISQRDARPQLKIHIKAALKAGLSKQEILASIFHLMMYVGVPATINALTAAKETFDEMKAS